jgi:hypothetical protein
MMVVGSCVFSPYYSQVQIIRACTVKNIYYMH